jgi:hypothetical protein
LAAIGVGHLARRLGLQSLSLVGKVLLHIPQFATRFIEPSLKSFGAPIGFASGCALDVDFQRGAPLSRCEPFDGLCQRTLRLVSQRRRLRKSGIEALPKLLGLRPRFGQLGFNFLSDCTLLMEKGVSLGQVCL